MIELDRHSTSIVVHMAPAWEKIEPLRQYVVATAGGAGERIAGRVGIVLQELLENAVKYGDAMSHIDVQVIISSVRKHAEVRVANRAQPSRIALLKKEYEGMQGGTEAAGAAFARALTRSQRLPQGSTMLGLARIATESALTLEISGDQVAMTARIQ
jgi:two-component sensor histidine kinase